MDLREEYERFQKAQQEAPKLIAKAKAYGSTTSDRARAAAARRDAGPERMLKKIAEARAKEARDIDRLVPSELQHALLALMRLEINNLLPHPLRGLTECYTDDEAPLVAKLDAEGYAYWGPDMWAGGASVYSSYFRVVDASDLDQYGHPTNCKVGVTNGSAAILDPLGSCGTVKINNERADVAAVTETLSAAGTYYVWIHSWIDAEDGPKSEIIVGDVDDDDPPDNVNAGITFSSQLAGRVQVTEADGVYSIAGITQDYLRGGEYETWLWGDCPGLELEE